MADAKMPSEGEIRRAERAAMRAAEQGKDLDRNNARILASAGTVDPGRIARLSRNIRNKAQKQEQARMKAEKSTPKGTTKGGGGLFSPRNRGLRG